MAAEWRTVRFQTLIDEGVLEIGDGYRAKLEELGSGGPIFLRAGHVSDTHIDFNEVEYFRPELTPAVRSKMSRAGDTVITTKGNSTGRTAFVTDDMPEFVYSPHLSYWRSLDRSRLEPGFLRYWSKGAEFTGQLHGMMESTDMAPYLSLSDQRRLSITFPRIGMQRAIARVLGTLDDKIELNRRMNQTLEGMARAVFRSWFVDFDPVVAKAAGRRPVGMTAATAALFPDAFADSPLGPIPKGWEVRSFIELMELHRGYDLPTRERVAGPIPIVSSSGISGWHRTSAVKGPGIVTGRYGTIGEVYFVEGDYWPLNTTLYVRDFKGNPPRFLFHMLEQVDFNQFTDKAAVPGVNRNDIHRSLVTIPPPPLRDSFENQVRPFWHRHSVTASESDTLCLLRDALLPRLLSGEMRLRDAERAVGAVV